jgi:hypothetical protein
MFGIDWDDARPLPLPSSRNERIGGEAVRAMVAKGCGDLVVRCDRLERSDVMVPDREIRLATAWGNVECEVCERESE